VRVHILENLKKELRPTVGRPY